MPATILPRHNASAKLFTLILADDEVACERADHAMSRAQTERILRGVRPWVCGPQGWILTGDGRVIAGPMGERDWEVFSIGYDNGCAVLDGYNRCTGEVFSWRMFCLPTSYDARYGFHHARVVDERGLAILQRVGYELA